MSTLAVLLSSGATSALAEDSGAAPAMVDWAPKSVDDSGGRTLPLANSWSAVRAWSPQRIVERIERGEHILLTFEDPSFVAFNVEFAEDPAAAAREAVEQRYGEALHYARENNLPIAIRGWNWAAEPVRWQDVRIRQGMEIPDEKRANVLVDGKVLEGHAVTDPFGPVEAWREWGEFWMGNAVLRRMQEIYPNPPAVIFLNNNEAGEFIQSDIENHDRFVARYGKGPHTEEFKHKVMREGYGERYAAMLEAARAALVEPAWRKNARYVAYNSLWGTAYIGHNGQPRPGYDFDGETGWTRWHFHPDGSMPELYDNDWQPGKTDYQPWSPQTEAMNYYAMQERVFAERPDFLWTSIVWDGGVISEVWRGRRSSSKPFHYVTHGQRWDADRYMGWIQFGLWTTRPSIYSEFRWDGGKERQHVVWDLTFDALTRSVDNVWNHETLREFWRFGKLVPNPAEEHWWPTAENHPQWLRDLKRWYLLTADANPPRDEWKNNTKLRVFAQALVLGEKPERRWLIYAHAPLGAVAEVKVTVPDHREVTLASVPKSGSFFLLSEADGSLRPLIVGGPNELALKADHTWAKAGEAVRFDPGVAHAPDAVFTEFKWSFGDGKTLQQNELAALEHTFDKPGTYLVTLEGQVSEGDSLIEQVAVFVGEKLREEVLYDLSMSEAFAWNAPWAGWQETAVNYHHLPNRGSQPSAVVVGGTFVEDEQRGRALEFRGGEHQAVWLVRNDDTVMNREGHANQTISLWFKADAAEGRQVIYAQGFEHNGFNIYLDGDTLRGGSWSPGTSMDHEGWHPVWGRKFDGHWLSVPFTPGQWHHVALVLEGAGDVVEDNRQHLYLNGKLAASGPGVRIPRQYAPPRLGRAPIDGVLLTRFHDGETQADLFRGRLSDFQLVLDAVQPE